MKLNEQKKFARQFDNVQKEWKKKLVFTVFTTSSQQNREKVNNNRSNAIRRVENLFVFKRKETFKQFSK
jgi:hypothetical protein